jgi:hypothetical protein
VGEESDAIRLSRKSKNSWEKRDETKIQHNRYNSIDRFNRFVGSCDCHELDGLTAAAHKIFTVTTRLFDSLRVAGTTVSLEKFLG